MEQQNTCWPAQGIRTWMARHFCPHALGWLAFNCNVLQNNKTETFERQKKKKNFFFKCEKLYTPPFILSSKCKILFILFPPGVNSHFQSGLLSMYIQYAHVQPMGTLCAEHLKHTQNKHVIRDKKTGRKYEKPRPI